MMTVTVNVKKHLAEFLYGKYNNGDNKTPVKLSTKDDLYHMKWQLMRKRPVNVPLTDDGNLTFELDENHQGKSPLTYNYLDKQSTSIIEAKIEALMFMELHSRIDDNRMDGMPYTTQGVIHMFMCEYCIDSITEDALQKNIWRHNQKIARRKNRRKYDRKH